MIDNMTCKVESTEPVFVKNSRTIKRRIKIYE